MLKITKYADRLIDDLEDVNYQERIKSQQINWIGRSYGCEIDFSITKSNDKLKVYTTRPDTIFGATYMVIACEHPMIAKNSDNIINIDDINKYCDLVTKKSELERTQLNKEKTGIRVEGLNAINPATGREIPIYVSDYVLMSYGTGAIMAVPAHDTRDYEFAKEFNLPIVEVVSGGDITEEAYTDTEDGIMVNSGFLNNLTVSEAKEKIADFIESNNLGYKKTNYKLRDWVFSRQRYWGEPIPLVHCEDCGWVAVPEKELPIKLPEVKEYVPTDDGESPLAKIDSFVNTKCPVCGKGAKRETDTMPQWAGSSWYYLRYCDPTNNELLASKENINYYQPVDWYNGGMEHTTLHLLYSRFWHKFLYDIDVVNTKEPYMKRTSHGMILGNNGEKMSKSRGNVINPDDIISNYGADTLRTYEMFIGDFEKSVPWSENGVKGCRKFLERVWNLQFNVDENYNSTKDIDNLVHKTIKKVSEDFETLKFNTGIAQLMTLLNEFNAVGKVSKEDFRKFLILLNPVAPHITEEIWSRIGYDKHIYDSSWPAYDINKTVDEEINLPVQINGKLKGNIKINIDEDEDSIFEKINNDESINKFFIDKTIVKKIYVNGKIFNVVIK